MKKIISLFLALITLLSMAVQSFAASGTKSPKPIVPEIVKAWEYDEDKKEWVEVNLDLDDDGYLKLVVTPYEKKLDPNTKYDYVKDYIEEHLEDAYALRNECIPLASSYKGIPEEELAIASIFDITWEDIKKDIKGIRIQLTGFNEDNFVCLLHKNHEYEGNNLDERWFVEETARMEGDYLYIDTPHLSSFAVIVNKETEPYSPSRPHRGTYETEEEGIETVSPVTGSNDNRLGILFIIVGISLAFYAFSKREKGIVKGK